MANSTDNPVVKVAQVGASNALWYYNDGDAIGTIVGTDYFLADYKLLTGGDIVIVSSGGSNTVVDTLIISASTSSTVTTVIEA